MSNLVAVTLRFLFKVNLLAVSFTIAKEVGKISHKISLSSFSISNSAASKIKESGGEVLKFSEMIEKYPTGTGVKIIG